MPIFPLHTVLYPGGELTLKVFEPRYLDMITSVIKADSLLGVVAIIEGSEVGKTPSIAMVGTVAKIVDFEPLPNGFLGVTVVGQQRFRLLATEVQPDQLMVGTIQILDRPVPITVAPPFDVIVDLLKSVSGDDLELQDDADWVVDRLAGSIPLPQDDRQTLLELDDPEDRLVFLYAKLQRIPSGQG